MGRKNQHPRSVDTEIRIDLNTGSELSHLVGGCGMEWV
jgi:hypothetical protein